MSVVLDRGSLGPSWHCDGSSLSLRQRGEGRGEGQLHLDCAFSPDTVLQPGAVNAHTHLYSGLAPLQMPPPPRPPKNFVEILELVWWRLDRALDEQSLRASARFALAEGLLAGTTAYIDHHESPSLVDGSLDILADAAQELGARLLVCYGATERNFGRDEAKRGLRECERFIRTNRRPLVKGLIALHASFTVSDDTVREAGALTKLLGAGLHVHVAEDLADCEDAKKRGYPGPLERLFDLGALPAGSVVAHGVHLDEAQIRRADAAGVWLVQNPRSNEGNKVGYPRALAASTHVALGTDGWPADMQLERDALFRLGRAHQETDATLQERVDGGWQLVNWLMKTKVGAVEAGATADVVVGVPGQRPRHVVVDGRPVVVDGKLVTADLEEIRARANEAAPALWKRMGALGSRA